MGSKNSSLSVSAGYTEIVIESESKNSRGSPGQLINPRIMYFSLKDGDIVA